MKNARGFFGQLLHPIWHLFLNGLFAILPITVTLGLLNLSTRMILEWLRPLQELLVRHLPNLMKAIPYAEVAIVIVALVLLGSLLNLFLMRSVVHTIEELVVRIPLIRPIYSGVKQLVTAFSIQDKMTFKRVVVVEFPRPGIYSLGFLTSELPAEIAPDTKQKFFSVFIPTTPNPTSGFFVMVQESDLRMTTLTRQEAMAMIISGGIIQPDRFDSSEAE